jgi:hypothetical protein
MNVGKFILNVVIAFVAYFVLYMGTMSVLLGDVYAVNANLMRAEDDPLMMYAMLGHLFQTIVVVALFNMAVGSGDVGKGVRFGVLIGAYLAATDMTTYFSLNMNTGPVVYSLVIHIVVGAIIGALLAFLWSKGLGSGKAAPAAVSAPES